MLAQLFLSLPCPDDVSCDVHPPSRCLPWSLGPASDVFISPLVFPVLSAFDILEADGVCQVCLNSGERAGGAICGVWRASLLVIIFPGVLHDEVKAHCCIITSCR